MKISRQSYATLLYLVLATAWIGFSNRAMAVLVHDPRLLVLAMTIKSWLFVLVTGMMLYWLMGRGRWHPVTADRPLRGDHERVTHVLLSLMQFFRNGAADDAYLISRMAVGLGKLAGVRGEILRHLEIGALLHDVGHLAIPTTRTEKQSRLTAREMTQMRRHPKIGHELLEQAGFAPAVSEIAHAHHERWDGFGYPRGLTGDAIPLVARIVSIVDVWHALSSDRGYRSGWSETEVLAYLRYGAGSQFDPELTALFLDNYDSLKSAAAPICVLAKGQDVAAVNMAEMTTA